MTAAVVAALPRSRVMGLFGDSRAFLSHSGGGDGSGTNHNYLKGFGLAHHIQAESGGRIQVPWKYQGGRAGDTTKQMLDRLPAYITLLKAGNVNLVTVIGGTNDRTGGQLDLGTTKQNIRRIVRTFLQNGIAVVLCNDTPRGTGSSQYELAQLAWRQDHYDYSRWVLTDMSQMCAVANTYDAWLNPKSGLNFFPHAIMIQDGIHPSKIGGQVAGKLVADVAVPFVGGLPDLLESNTLYNAASNPIGSLTANPMLTGTTGKLNANCNPVAGSKLATGWEAEGENMTGLKTWWSKELVKGVEWQKLVITGTAGATKGVVTAFVDIPLASLVDKDVLRVTGLFRSLGAGLGNVSLNLLMTPTWTVKCDPDNSDDKLPWPAYEVGPVTREVPELVFATASNHTLLRVRVQVETGVSQAVDAAVWFTKTGACKAT